MQLRSRSWFWWLLASVPAWACGGEPDRGSAPALQGGQGVAEQPTGGTTGGATISGGTANGGVAASGRPGSTGGLATTGGTVAATGGQAGAGTGGVTATGGTAAGAAGGSSEANGLGPFVCPPGPYAASPISGAAALERIEGVPPSDGFIASEDELSIVEGPVWLDGNLYVSQINNGSLFRPGRPGEGGGGGAAGTAGSGGSGGSQPPPSRILKITQTGEVSVALADAGTNGLAVSPDGQLVGCNHKTGAITRLDLTGAAPIEIVSQYDGARFDSPNDLTFGADGTLYFTDPDYQAPSPLPQSATRAYRVAPGSATAVALVEDRPRPNGITLSPDRKALYVSASDGVSAYPVLADGSVGPGVAFGQGVARSSDGMAVDCAGNLYTTSGQTVLVLTPTGSELTRISVPDVQQVTNVAFGGPSRTTLYITAQGMGQRSGLFKVESAIPGMPY